MRLLPFNSLVYLLSITAALVLGLMVYVKAPNRRINRLFGIYIFSIISWIFANFMSDSLTNLQSVLMWTKLSLIGPYIFAPAILHISHIYPSGTISLKRTVSIWSASLIQILFVPSSHNIISASIEEWGANFVPGNLYILFSITLLTYIAWSLLNFISKYKKAHKAAKKQILLIIYGYIATVIVGVTVGAILPLVGYSRLAILGPSSSLLLLGALAYSVVRHKFLDISLIVFRAISYTILTLIIIGIYASFLLTIPNLVPENYHDFLTVILGILLVYSFTPLKRAIEHATRNVFYKQPYSSEKLLERLGEINRSTLELDALTKKVLDELTNTIGLTWGAFIIDSHKITEQTNTNHQENIFTKTVGLGHSIKLTTNTIHNIKKLAKGHIILFDELEENAEKMLLRHHNISVVIPLNVKNTHHGVILLGEKSSGEIYSQQDTSVLEIFMPQISVAIQNALSYEEISRFNITLREEVKAATKKLRISNKELKKLDKLKDDFIYIATHELKNPVTAMKGYLSLIKDDVYGKVPTKLKDPIDQLDNSSHELIVLINDLLQIARIEADSVKLHQETFDVCSLTDAVIGGLLPLAKQKSLELNHTCPKSLPEVFADQNKVREVINNLVSNAIKYTLDGSVTVSHEKDGQKVITHVKDTGVGISKKDQEKLFGRFYRVEKEAAKGIPGTGLGLYICKQLVEKMGGEIWVESSAGNGTTFSFSLPNKA